MVSLPPSWPEGLNQAKAMVNAGQILRISEIISEGRRIEDKAVRTWGKYVFSDFCTVHRWNEGPEERVDLVFDG